MAMPAKNIVIANAIVARAETYLGIPYHLGAEPSLASEPPNKLDCSELTERVFRLTPGAPRIPDGSYNQALPSVIKRVSVEDVLHYPAALVFVSSPGKGVHHVGLTVGDGVNVIEANGGKKIMKVIKRKPRKGYWTFGGFVYGLHLSKPK